MKKSLLSALFLLGAMGAAETAAAQTPAFVQWPLKRNNADSAAVRTPSASLTVAAARLTHLVLSNGLPGTTTSAYAPYSSNGQAFATAATGAGGSTTISSGPRRGWYEQFAITNSGTAALRVDSLIFTASTTSSANGRAAVSYSTTGFVTDSTDFSGGGKGPAGALTSTNNGSFGPPTSSTSSQLAVNPLVLPQYVAGSASSASTFRLAFVSGGTGVSIAAGRTLTVRLYFRVGSDTEGRYFLLRNVILKSTQAVLATRSAVQNTNLAVYPNPAQSQLNVPHAAASRDARVTVFSAIGAKVASFATQPGTTETAIDLGALSKGLYLVEYADGDQRSSARIVKE